MISDGGIGTHFKSLFGGIIQMTTGNSYLAFFLLFVFLFVFFLWDNFAAIKCKLLEFSLVELEESDSESCG